MCGRRGLTRPRPVGDRFFLSVAIATGQVITFLLAAGRTRDTEPIAVVATTVPFILGFARTTPVKVSWLLFHRSGGAGRRAAVPSTWAPARRIRACA